MGFPSLSRRAAVEVAPSARLLSLASHAISALALLCLVILAWTLLTNPSPGKSGWPAALLVVTTALASIASLGRILPGPNVLIAGVIIGFVGGVAHGVGTLTAYPFGPFVFEAAAGPKFFNTLAWPMPFIWIIAVLNARGVAKLILRPWRKLKRYGFWLIGVTAALVVLFDLALEPFAAHVNHFWRWLPTKFTFSWYGASLVNSLGWLITTLLILVFTTPALTKKQSRGKKNPADYHPLIVWLLTFALFAIVAFQNRLWPAFAHCLLTGIVSAILAVRGARW